MNLKVCPVLGRDGNGWKSEDLLGEAAPPRAIRLGPSKRCFLVSPAVCGAPDWPRLAADCAPEPVFEDMSAAPAPRPIDNRGSPIVFWISGFKELKLDRGEPEG